MCSKLARAIYGALANLLFGMGRQLPAAPPEKALRHAYIICVTPNYPQLKARYHNRCIQYGLHTATMRVPTVVMRVTY
eukprot:6121537-Pleurochrysis_carterae.AAC.1